MVRPVDDGDLDRRVAQRPGGEQPAEPSADDHYPVRHGAPPSAATSA
jgi:hypothetical protein